MSTADRPATEPRTRYEDVAEGRRISDVGGESSLVRTLSDAMLAKLAKNRGKRHWQDAAPTYLIDRLRQEVEELEQAIGGYLEEGSADENDVWAEAADVANFAAMLADNATGRAEAAQGAAPLPATVDAFCTCSACEGRTAETPRRLTMSDRRYHDHPRPFCGEGCPAYGNSFARYDKRFIRSSDPEPAPPPDDRDWTAEFHALDDAINERLRAEAVPALQATGEPSYTAEDIKRAVRIVTDNESYDLGYVKECARLANDVIDHLRAGATGEGERHE